MKRFKTSMSALGLALAMLAGIATGAAAPSANSCLSICRQVYQQCIASGGGMAECEDLRDQCHADCAPASKKG